MKREITAKIISRLKFEHLNDDEKQIAELIGTENIMKLKQECGGFSYHLQKLQSHQNVIYDIIKDEYLGKPLKKIAQDFDISIFLARKIVDSISRNIPARNKRRKNRYGHLQKESLFESIKFISEE